MLHGVNLCVVQCGCHTKWPSQLTLQTKPAGCGQPGRFQARNHGGDVRNVPWARVWIDRKLTSSCPKLWALWAEGSSIDSRARTERETGPKGLAIESKRDPNDRRLVELLSAVRAPNWRTHGTCVSEV